jgi:alpha-galactosidase
LNFGIEGARVHARDAMLRILRVTGARWVKWDFNEDLLRGGWADRTPADLARLDPLVAHIRGVYLLQDELHAALPDLIIEMCASGGGRFDGEILRRAHVQWMSDQWEPLKNLSIHFGSQLCHPAEQCNDWLIQWPADTDLRGDLLFRLRVAMLGSFGLSAKIGHWPQADLDTAAAEIDWYKSTARPLVRDGDQYILTKAPTLGGHGDWAAMWFAAKDQSGGMALIFRLLAEEPSHRFALHGLDPSATYRLSIPGHPGQELTGAALVNGVSVTVPELYQSTRLTVMRVAS